jgi:hypothetical protein
MTLKRSAPRRLSKPNASDHAGSARESVLGKEEGGLIVTMSTIDPETACRHRRIGQRPGFEPPRRRGPLSLTAVLLAPLGIIFVAGVAGLGGCAAQSGAVVEAGVRQPAPEPGHGLPTRLASADLEVVDCQLPPRIRRLGIDLTYLGAQRQIRTTARDCAIRGGNSVAPETASRA